MFYHRKQRNLKKDKFCHVAGASAATLATIGASAATAGASIAGATSGGKGGSSSPPTPALVPNYNPSALAGQQANINSAAAMQQARIGNPNVITPIGSSRYEYGTDQNAFNSANQQYQAKKSEMERQNSEIDRYNNQLLSVMGQNGVPYMKQKINPADIGQAPSEDAYRTATNIQSLSPAEQALLEQQQAIQRGGNENTLAMSALAGQMIPGLGKALDPALLDQAGIHGRDATIQAILSRANPQQEIQRNAMQTRLANAGIVPGSAAWSQEMKQQGQNENDLSMQAELAGNTEQNTLWQQALTGQQQALSNVRNLYNPTATMTMPTYQGYNAPSVQPANLMGAYSLNQGANAQNANSINSYNTNAYNQQMGINNANTSALAGLGGAGLNAFGSWAGSKSGSDSLSKLFGTSANSAGAIGGNGRM
jgi:hypothetical protein